MSGWDDTGSIPPPTVREHRRGAGSEPSRQPEEEILVGDRRMRVRRRRRSRLRASPWIILAVVVALVAVGAGTYLYLNRPQGLQTVDGPAIVAPGGFQAIAGADGTITVALEIRNVTDEAVTVAGARVVPPAGLTQTALSVLPPGEQNQNLNLDDDLPLSSPVVLGTAGVERNGIVAARFQVSCGELPPSAGATGEQIFVTVRLGADQREEQLTPPVLGGTPWLTATARGACGPPVGTGEAPSPLPPLPSA